MFRAVRYTKELFAPIVGFEPTSTVLETGMLPLHQTDVLYFIVSMSVLTLHHYYKTYVGIIGLEPMTFDVSDQRSTN